jgi:hypothetical protein
MDNIGIIIYLYLNRNRRRNRHFSVGFNNTEENKSD